jgi:hypothetical protein
MWSTLAGKNLQGSRTHRALEQGHHDLDFPAVLHFLKGLAGNAMQLGAERGALAVACNT